MIRKYIYLIFILTCLAKPNPCFADDLFELSDSNPASSQYRKKFLASYGINPAIEPKLSEKDRPLQEKVLPHIGNNPQKAIEIIESTIESDTNPAFLNVLGNLYYQIQDYTQSEKYLIQSLKKFPSLRRSWRTLALCYVQQDKLEKAIKPLLKVIELGGGDAQSYGLLAYSYLNGEKFESALSAYRMARMFEPDSFDFKRGQALCLLNTNQSKSAIALFDELIQDEPNEPSFWTAQASAYLEMNQTDKAIANLQILHDLEMSDWKSLNLLGDLFLKKTLPELATKYYTLALDYGNQQNTNQLLRPLNNLLSQNYFKQANALMKSINAVTGNKTLLGKSIDYQFMKAKIELNTGSAEVALNILEKIISKDPLDGKSLLLLGQYHLDEKEFQKAEFYIERATHIKNYKVQALIALGQLKVAEGKLAAAIPFLDKAMLLKPSRNLELFIRSIKDALIK